MVAKKKRKAFASHRLYRHREPHAVHYLTQPVTFWIAVLCVFAFVTGNMMGQHGWRIFWKSVMGEGAESLVHYTGTVTPVEFVPNYADWSTYGGDGTQHLFAEVPLNDRIPMPAYTAFSDGSKQSKLAQSVYSVDYAGNYEGTGPGSHAGVDIRVPQGTPVRAVMAAVVVKVATDTYGFGKYVLLEHPNVPDPNVPGKTIMLYSLYAHLSSQLVKEGDVIDKGFVIGLSGMTGDATGPHLHFQMQLPACTDDGTKLGATDFWPYTATDARNAGVSFSDGVDQGLKRDHLLHCTTNPMLYVQAHASDQGLTVATATTAQSSSTKLTPAQLLAQRKAARLARLQFSNQTVVTYAGPIVPLPASSSSSVASHSQAGAASSVASSVSSASSAPASSDVATVRIEDSGRFSSLTTPQSVTIVLLDANGNVVTHPTFSGTWALRPTFGNAVLSKSEFTAADFQMANGRLTVQLTPKSKSTIVLQLLPRGDLSDPLKYVP